MRLTITITCTPKQGRTDRLTDTIAAAVRKHAKRKRWTVTTQYHQEDNQ